MSQPLARALKKVAGSYVSSAAAHALSIVASTVIWSLRHWTCCTVVAMMASSSPRYAPGDMALARTCCRLSWPFCTT